MRLGISQVFVAKSSYLIMSFSKKERKKKNFRDQCLKGVIPVSLSFGSVLVAQAVRKMTNVKIWANLSICVIILRVVLFTARSKPCTDSGSSESEQGREALSSLGPRYRNWRDANPFPALSVVQCECVPHPSGKIRLISPAQHFPLLWAVSAAQGRFWSCLRSCAPAAGRAVLLQCCCSEVSPAPCLAAQAGVSKGRGDLSSCPRQWWTKGALWAAAGSAVPPSSPAPGCSVSW